MLTDLWQATNDMLSLLMAIAMAAGIRGMWPLARFHDNSATMYLARGLVLIFTAAMLRSLYWDVLPTVLRHLDLFDAWVRTGAASGAVNSIFIALNLWGFWHVMRALQEILPIGERADWPIWRIPFYPRGTCWARLVRYFGREK